MKSVKEEQNYNSHTIADVKNDWHIFYHLQMYRTRKGNNMN